MNHQCHRLVNRLCSILGTSSHHDDNARLHTFDSTLHINDCFYFLNTPHPHTLCHSGVNSPLAASAYALTVYPSTAFYNQYITQGPVQLG